MDSLAQEQGCIANGEGHSGAICWHSNSLDTSCQQLAVMSCPFSHLPGPATSSLAKHVPGWLCFDNNSSCFKTCPFKGYSSIEVVDLFVLQICEAFGANRYPFPEEGTRQRQMNAEVTARLRELQTTIEAGMQQS